MSRVYDCTIIQISNITNSKGNISTVDYENSLPFQVNRIFFIYDIPSGKDRGGHAHKACHQFLVAVSGAFEVEVYDGVNSRTFKLDRPFYGLHIPPGMWASQKNFSSSAVCLVLASEDYLESDYIRNIEEYRRYLDRF